MVKENVRSVLPGGLVLIVLLAAMVYTGIEFQGALKLHDSPLKAVIAFVVECVLLKGLFVVNPNEAVVLQLFGNYVGTVKEAGLKWANPFYTMRKVSQRIVNLQTEHMKVNDLDGNPIEIAAILVWRVRDTARALFDVDDYANFVEVQGEAALRNMATSYAYDAHDDKNHSLRGNTAEIAAHLQKEIQHSVDRAGIEILESRISHLAYAPEIAQAMLQRQQASAIIAARQKIVEGAVGMVEMALARLSQHKVVELDEERKANMVSNLLVVLCGERATQPVINAGSIY